MDPGRKLHGTGLLISDTMNIVVSDILNSDLPRTNTNAHELIVQNLVVVRAGSW